MSRSMLAGAFAAAILLASGAAGATSFGQPDNQQNQDEIVCRRITPDVGTIMTRRVCKTRAQWASEAAAAQRRVVDREARSSLGRRDDN